MNHWLFTLFLLLAAVPARAELVGYWNFDEPAETEAAINAVSGAAAELHDATRVSGKYGAALHFNGTTSFVLVTGSDTGSSNVLALANSPYTVSWWEKWAGPSGDTQALIAMNDGKDFSGGYDFFINEDGTFTADHNSGSIQSWTVPLPLVTNGWQHIAITWDGVKRRLYFNGVLWSEILNAGNLFSDGDDPLAFGALVAPCCGGPSHFYSGDLDEIRIYNSALGAAQIKAIQTNAAPVILTQPRDRNVAEGETVTLVVNAQSPDGQTVRFQWTRNGVDIPGATNSSYQTERMYSPGMNSYAVRVETPGSSTTSRTAIVQLLPAAIANLLGYWNFDEVSGTQASEATGRFPAQLVNAEHIPGRVGQGAIRLNGTNAYVSVGGIGSGLQLTNSGYTFAWWQRWAGPDGKYQEIIAMDDAEDTSAGYAFHIAPDGSFKAVHNNGPYQHWTPGVPLQRDEWQHFAITFDGTLRRFYVNGSFFAQLPTAGYLASDGDDPLLFGAADDPNLGGPALFFNGDLDEIRIYGGPLSPRSIAALASGESPDLSEGLVAWYPLNGDARDLSSNGFDGVSLGTVPTSDRFGQPDSALFFDGQSSYVNCGNPPQFNFASDFTFTLWAKLDASQPGRYLIAKSYDGTVGRSTNSYGLALGNNSELYGVLNSDPASLVAGGGGPPLSDGKWHAIAFVYERAFGMRFYLDGAQVASVPAANLPPFTSSLPLTIGAAFSGQFFRGALDDVRVFNRALNAAEVNRLYMSDLSSGISIAPAVKLELPTVAGRNYRLEGSNNLQDWIQIGAPFTAQSAPTVMYIDASLGYHYFRSVLIP